MRERERERELMDRDLSCPQPEYVGHTKSDISVSKLTWLPAIVATYKCMYVQYRYQ